MNAIFFTQSGSLDMFFALSSKMQRDGLLEKIGFYVTDSFYFDNFCKKNPEILKYPILKEWEIVQEGKRRNPCIKKLKEFEEKLGNPFLWGAVVGDRRLYLGAKSALYQTNRSPLDHTQMLSILQEVTERLNVFFDEINPDFVLSFICVTIGEYMGYMISNERGIKFLNLRPTRIKNYIYAADTIFEPPQSFISKYNSLSELYKDKKAIQEAEDYLNGFKKHELLYEGVHTSKKERRKIINYFLKIPEKVRSIIRIIFQEYQFKVGKYKNDNHLIGFIWPAIYKKILKPLRIKTIDILLKNKYVKESDLKSIEYAFYPLHKEPEATLLVYNKYFLDQIELIRNIAQSLPIGMKLLVKEHPASVGYRPVSYYKRILEIPNVSLVDPRVKSWTLIKNAKMVTVLGGTVGFEALMLQKPVIIIGNALYEVISSNMLEKVKDITSLPAKIDELIKNYQYEEEKIINYIAYIIKNSVGVDLYSKLLKKREAHSISEKETFDTQIEKLKDYLIKCVNYNIEGRRIFYSGMAI